MQRSEFNNAMNGLPSRFADLSEISAEDGLFGLMANAKQKGASRDAVAEAREAIKKIEQEISPAEKSRMDEFINKQRALNTKERTIRRMVQRMWNITVV